MASHPRAADLLEHLTALGRSLGVHLILATQRPLGVVTGQMKANINIRVCLRVRDATDSIDVIGTEAGAFLPADKPGAACVDSGVSLCQFRTAVPFGADTRPEATLRPRVRAWVRGPVPSLAGGVAGVHVENIIAAAEGSSVRTQQQVVLPPLPELVDLSDLGTGVPARSLTGLIDIPGEQRQEQWVFDPAVDGSVMLTGGESEIVDAVLMRMAHAAAPTRRIIAVGTIATALDWAEIACGMTSGWRIQAVLEHLAPERAQTAHPPSLLVCGNWEELVASLDHHWADRLERLLSHGAGAGLGFLLAGCRSSTSRSSRFATQIIFPPVTGEDGLSVGLSRQRFAGRWPDFRAVIRGPRVLSAGGDGADVQLVPDPGEHRSDNVVGHQGDCVPFEPRWHGLESADEPVVPAGLAAGFTAKARQSRFLLGVDAFGEVVEWDPVREGSVLTVRGSAQSGKSECAELIAAPGRGEIAVHDDAHQSAESIDWDLQDGRTHVLTLPLRFSSGYGSPLAKAQDLGPLLVLGVHTRHDLASLGLIRQAPLDGTPGTGWFVTEDRARAIRLFTRDEIEKISQLRLAGGPERVS